MERLKRKDEVLLMAEEAIKQLEQMNTEQEKNLTIREQQMR